MKTTLLFAIVLLSTTLQAQTYSNTTALPIPDGVLTTTGCGSGASPGIATSNINVPLVGTVIDGTKITINLDLTHSYLGDVLAELRTPAGGSCALIKRMGATTDLACGDNSNFGAGNILSFKAANTTLINYAAATTTSSIIPGGNYAPTGMSSIYPVTIPLCDLNTFFNGVSTNGNWSLRMYDNGSGETGTLNSWQLIFDTGSVLSNSQFIFSKSIALLGNPFKEELKLNFDNKDTDTSSLHIYTIDGKELYKKEYTNSDSSKTISIDSNAWPKGFYLIVAEINGVKQNAIKAIKN